MGSIVALSSPNSAKDTSLSQSHSANVDEDANTFKSFERSKSTPLLMDGIKEKGLPLLSPHESAGRLFRSSSIMLMEEKSQGQSSGNLHDKLDHAIIDAENSKQKAFQEAVKRWKAEEDAMDALHEAEASESSWKKEATQRKEMEGTLARQRQELEEMMNQRDECMEELQMVQDQNPVLETRITKSRGMERELEEKIIQAVNLLITFKERRDELWADRDNAIVEVNKLRKLVEKDTVSFCRSQFLTPSFLEVIEATQNFDPSWKIGEGRCGSVYKGLLCHVKVAIKMLPSVGSQGDAEFKHEVEILSRVRHPNLVILIGNCPESRSLILEYLENGSLEDRLGCQGKTTPLPWKTRIKIATEICSTLIFLHSNKPPFIHGNLKLTNVLLDTNYVSKLSDLGMYRLIPGGRFDRDVSGYMDPEFLNTGELTVYSDIYSYGIVLLRILTGRPASGVLKDVKCALENDKFSTLLDSSAGDWPIEQGKQLAELALRCCEKNPLNRPDLLSDVWTAIEPMRDLYTTTSHLESEGHRRVPSHFVCPIFQEVMKDPYIAADGFTYEADAIKGWLNSGHKTSPMTNLKLDHCDLLPNYALYYAIQEWMQQP